VAASAPVAADSGDGVSAGGVGASPGHARSSWEPAAAAPALAADGSELAAARTTLSPASALGAGDGAASADIVSSCSSGGPSEEGAGSSDASFHERWRRRKAQKAERRKLNPKGTYGALVRNDHDHGAGEGERRKSGCSVAFAPFDEELLLPGLGGDAFGAQEIASTAGDPVLSVAVIAPENDKFCKSEHKVAWRRSWHCETPSCASEVPHTRKPNYDSL